MNVSMDGGPARVALLGLGEAGSGIAAGLVAAGADVRGYDPLVGPPPGCARRQNESDAVRDAELVLSVNSGPDAVPALAAAMQALRPGSVWADLNTASPGLKRQLATLIAGRGVQLVDVALLAPVPGRGLRTPMMMSGPGAQRCADLLRGWGLRWSWWMATIVPLVEGTHPHARRRTDEMAAPAEQLCELGVRPRIAAHDLLAELRDRAG